MRERTRTTPTPATLMLEVRTQAIRRARVRLTRMPIFQRMPIAAVFLQTLA